jgi:hypothetical protein
MIGYWPTPPANDRIGKLWITGPTRPDWLLFSHGGRMNRRSRALVSVLGAALLMSVAGAAAAQNGDVAKHPMIGDAAPPFKLESTAGKTHSLEEWKGKYIVLHFGASW